MRRSKSRLRFTAKLDPFAWIGLLKSFFPIRRARSFREPRPLAQFVRRIAFYKSSPLCRLLQHFSESSTKRIGETCKPPEKVIGHSSKRGKIAGIRRRVQFEHATISRLPISKWSRLNLFIAQHSLKSGVTSRERVAEIFRGGTVFKRVPHLNCGHFLGEYTGQQRTDRVRQARSSGISHRKQLGHFELFVGRLLDESREDANCL